MDQRESLEEIEQKIEDFRHIKDTHGLNQEEKKEMERLKSIRKSRIYRNRIKQEKIE